MLGRRFARCEPVQMQMNKRRAKILYRPCYRAAFLLTRDLRYVCLRWATTTDLSATR
jgi:hypothetical protein